MSDNVHVVAPMAKEAVEMFAQRGDTFTAYDITKYLRQNLSMRVDHNYAVRPVVHATMEEYLDDGTYERRLEDFPGGEAWVYSPVQDTTPRMVEVDSTAIYKVGYEPNKNLLHVQFHSGKYYTYGSVSPDVYAQLMSADSIGGYFNQFIRRGPR